MLSSTTHPATRPARPRAGASTRTMVGSADLLMLHGVVAVCPDCRSRRVMLPTGSPGELCCTACDAAVFVLAGTEPRVRAARADAS